MNKIIIKREKYIKQIRAFINKDIVKVIIWQRRVGKSFILKQIIDELMFYNIILVIFISKNIKQKRNDKLKVFTS